MKVITICSPDKISLNMCISFLTRRLGKSYQIGDLHSLMSKESIESYINDFFNKNGNKAIFSYYAKRKINVDPKTTVPERLQEVSDVVVWFKLYSTEMMIIKDESGFQNLFEKDWNTAVERLNKMHP